MRPRRRPAVWRPRQVCTERRNEVETQKACRRFSCGDGWCQPMRVRQAVALIDAGARHGRLHPGGRRSANFSRTAANAELEVRGALHDRADRRERVLEYISGGRQYRLVGRIGAARLDMDPQRVASVERRIHYDPNLAAVDDGG